MSRYRVLIATARQMAPLLVLAAVTGNASALFDDDSVIDVELIGPMSSLIGNKSRSEESGFVISGDGFTIPVQLRARGNSRLVACPFPPLRLNFPSEGIAGTVFEGQNHLKLVTHCNDKDRDANNVYEEYLAYRIMNLISDRSYRVRPLRIQYLDTEAPARRNALEQHGFLIESDGELAQRLDGSIVQTEGVLYSRLDDRQATLVYVFQYLIGNTDWSLVKAESAKYCCHNIDLFERDGRTVIVPYDFDLAGLVDASYARPDPGLGLRDVRTRRYRGYCLSTEMLTEALDHVISLEGDILETVAASPASSDEAQEKRVTYIGKFFEQAHERDRLLRDFAKRCL